MDFFVDHCNRIKAADLNKIAPTTKTGLIEIISKWLKTFWQSDEPIKGKSSFYTYTYFNGKNIHKTRVVYQVQYVSDVD